MQAEHLYYRSDWGGAQEEPGEPQERRTSLCFFLLLFCCFFIFSFSGFFFYATLPATTDCARLSPPPRLSELFFLPDVFPVRKQPKRSQTRTTDNDPPSLLQSWCRWTANSLSACTPSCMSPNTRPCTPAPRPSAGPACPPPRWVPSCKHWWRLIEITGEK